MYFRFRNILRKIRENNNLHKYLMRKWDKKPEFAIQCTQSIHILLMCPVINLELR